MKTPSSTNPLPRSGLLYGLFAGFALAAALWGWDALLLWQARAMLPWARFLIGLTACLLTFGLAGWLTMRTEKALFGALFWLIAALIPAIFTPLLTFSIWPWLAPLLNPELAGRLALPTVDAQAPLWAQAPIWTQGIFSGINAVTFGVTALILGAVEVPMVEQTRLSTASGALTGPIILAMTVFTLAGLFADSTMHARLRTPLISLDKTIQFVATNDLTQVDKALARKMHTGALNQFKDRARLPYQMIVTNYNSTFDQVDILVNFDGVWAYCITSADQPSYCKALE